MVAIASLANGRVLLIRKKKPNAVSFNGAMVMKLGKSQIFCSYALDDGEIASMSINQSVNIQGQQNWKTLAGESYCDKNAGAVDPSHCQFKLS